MKLQTNIEGINAEVEEERLVISSKKSLKVLSSAYHNGGLVEATGIVNFHISKKQDQAIHENPDLALEKAVMKLGSNPKKTVAMMTAAEMQNLGRAKRECEEMKLEIFTTAGVDVGATAGELTMSKYHELPPKLGTINIILIVDGNLTDGCLVDAAKTITEAKSVTLRELDVRSRFSGDLASGTVTDTVAVACTGRGKPMKFAGTGTVLGEFIGEMVKASLKPALEKQQGIVANRPLTQRLRERGILVTELATKFLDVQPEKQAKSKGSKEFTDRLQKTLDNPNVSQFVLAALRVDDDIKMGLIPPVAGDKIQIAEVLQGAVANCLSAKSQVKYDEKVKLSNKLGATTESVLSTIMKAVYDE